MSAASRTGVDSSLEMAIEAEVTHWEQAGLSRRISGPVGGNKAVDFCSNDYLGLRNHPVLVEATIRAVREYGAGGGASRLLGGGCKLHDLLEQAAADWLGTEATLLFPSGYQANLGLITSLAARGDAVFSDELNHASIVDACRLSRARVYVYAHGDICELERQLRHARGARRRLIVTESVFSMEGDLAPLPELCQLCERYDASLVLDEAHAIGLLGPDGTGAWGSLQQSSMHGNSLVARVITGGKALGVSGALVAGSDTLRKQLLNRARSFVFTTAPSPAIAGALSVAIDLMREMDDQRSRALRNARKLADWLQLPEPAAAIVPIVLGETKATMSVASQCQEMGFDVRPVRPPTVPEGTSRLRIVCHAFNEESDVERLAEELAPCDVVASSSFADRDRPLFVVGTDTGIGKTVVSAILLRHALAQGSAKYWKPVQTGNDSDSRTVSVLTGTGDEHFLQPLYELPLPASPHEAAEDSGIQIEPQEIRQALKKHRSALSQTTLIIELAGGLLVPYTLKNTQADLLQTIGAPLVLVARSGLGTLNHTLLTLEALRTRHLEPLALFLVGEPHSSNRETLATISGISRIFVVPIFPSLDEKALSGWLMNNDLNEVFQP